MTPKPIQAAQRRRSSHKMTLAQPTLRGTGLLALCWSIAIAVVLGLGHATRVGWLVPAITSPAPNETRMILLDLDRMLPVRLHGIINPLFDPSLSPDRQMLVYSAKQSTDTFGAGEITLRTVATGAEQRLTRDSIPDTSPDWSPDGSQIVFVSLRDFNTDLYLFDLASGAIQRLTDASRPDFDPDWSPDGHTLAYVSYDDENDSDLFLLDATCGGICGRNARQLIDDPGYDLQPTWSPDGKALAFISDRDGDGFQVFLLLGDCLALDQPCVGIRRLTDDIAARFELTWTRQGELLALVARAQGIDIYKLRVDCDQPQTGCAAISLGSVGGGVAG
ncbi:MAG: PD40 domain-containing protein [Anaerolineae bacterium]|nr:PD40 domain-containing protein [Anaerolineae bacterium]